MKISRNHRLTFVALLVIVGLLLLADSFLNPYYKRILNLCAIYSIFAVTFNLIFGYTGQFSLGHAGSAAIGAYISALLTLPPAQKSANFFLTPITPVLANLEIPFFPALILSGLGATLIGALVAWPALRLRGDYLAIATLGFSEIIRVLLVNFQTVTNGALGLKGIPGYTNLFWSCGSLIVCIFVVKRLVDSSYGRAMKAVRDDEVAAEALGVYLFKHKMMAFLVSNFFVGVAGGLLANLISTIDPRVFQFFLSYQIVGIAVMGGMGSLTGSVISACLYTIFLEALRPIESQFTIGGLVIPGIPGMRMVLFSIVLLLVILFYRRGLMGDKEFSWDGLIGLFTRFRSKKQAGSSGGTQS